MAMNYEYKLHLTADRVNSLRTKVLRMGLGSQAQVQTKADEKELLGEYSNLVMIHHTAEEFTFN